MRAFGVGLSDLGDAVTWGEAQDLIQSAASDPSTILGAELAGWAYPASIPDLLGLSAQIGNVTAARKIMPWAMKLPSPTEKPTADEVAVANAELEDSIVFA